MSNIYELKIKSDIENNEPLIIEKGEYQNKNKEAYRSMKEAAVKSHQRILKETGLTRLTTTLKLK